MTAWSRTLFAALVVGVLGGVVALAFLMPAAGPSHGHLDLVGRLASQVARRAGCRSCSVWYPASIGGVFSRYPLELAAPWAVVFSLAFIDWTCPWRVEHADLLALVGFFPATMLISAGHEEPGLLAATGCLVWLFVRLAGVAVGRFALPDLRPVLPGRWMVPALVALMLVRLLIALMSGTPLDVGVASATGAWRILHDVGVYGGAASWHVGHQMDVLRPDSYGPVAYLAYVPFVLAFGAPPHIFATLIPAVAADIMVVIGLDRLGQRLGGERHAHALAFMYIAYPFAALALFMQSNDALIAALAIWALVYLDRPAVRGALLALATMTKFVPGVLFVGLLRIRPGRWRYAAAFVATCAAVLTYPLLTSGLVVFWRRTFGFQSSRGAEFSAWSYAPHLLASGGRALAGLAVCALLTVAVGRDRQLSVRQWAALGAASLVGVQLALGYWTYIYIVWFFPLLAVAFIAPSPVETPDTPGDGAAAEAATAGDE